MATGKGDYRWSDQIELHLTKGGCFVDDRMETALKQIGNSKHLQNKYEPPKIYAVADLGAPQPDLTACAFAGGCPSKCGDYY